ncbi:AMP-binding protein [Pseudoalteromonas sp. SMS1]|uniref:non-ribosomal peptide synthetase n=1 Tax=Pseudoalteromonas sp. SMS1 TaxID=2908894 RepID=UPI001F37508C|nr:AMP-binding protein [Pseudoalteromonas sp. SMS1]MCF2858718.1 AMP-binding protein [Pseudoalteromonas sp. SMS1]
MFRNMIERLRFRADAFPDAMALLDDTQTLSNLTLWEKVSNRAQWFIEKGIKAQDNVAIYQARSADAVISMLALMSIRAVFIPLDRQLSNDGISARLKKAHCKRVVCDSPPKFQVAGVISVDLTKEPKIESTLIKCEPFRFGDLVYVLFTSGTTGEPKGVKVKYDSVYRHLAWKNTVYPVSGPSIELLKAPLSFDVSIRELLGFLFSKNALFVLTEGDEKRPDILCQKIHQLHLTEISVVPSFLFALLAYIEKFVHIETLSSLKRILVGGEVLPKTLVDKFIRIFGRENVALINLYGPTEATIEVTHFDCLSGSYTHLDSVPIGQAIYRDSLHILDTDGKPVQEGEIGELYIVGEQVALGYIGTKERMQNAFKTNYLSGRRSYKTGDLVKRLRDGNLAYCGRVDRQVKLNGKIINLETLASEIVPLLRAEDIRLTANTDDAAHTSIYLFVLVEVVIKRGLTPRDIQQHILKRCHVRIPTGQILTVLSWPKTQSGKCDLKAVADFVVSWPKQSATRSMLDYKAEGIVTQFEQVVQAAPNRTALIFGQERISYNALNKRINRVASCLRYEHNIKNDCMVAICATPSIDFITAILGVLKAGGAFVTLKAGDLFQPNEAYLQLSNCSPVLLLTDTEHKDRFVYPRLCIEELATDTYLPTQNLPNFRTPKSLNYLCYTSGSSSEPKGVLIEDFGLHHRLYNKQQRDPVRPSQGYLQLTTPQFDGAIWELFGWIYSSSYLVIMPECERTNPEKLLHYIGEYNIAEILMVPSQLHAFLSYVRTHNYEHTLSLLTRIRVGGEQVQRDTIELFKQTNTKNKIALINNYGPTEATIDVSQRTIHTLAIQDPISIGTAHEGVELLVLNEQLEEVDKGELGQLAIGGIGLMRGYMNGGEVLQNAFVAHPYNSHSQLYLTGDLAYQTDCGEFVVEGRVDEQIKIHGKRVDLSDLRHVFEEVLPFDTFKVLTMSTTLGTHILVFLLDRAVNNLASLTMEELKQLVKFKLPDYMVPKAYYSIDEFPRLDNGKIDRAALLRMHIDNDPNSDHDGMDISLFGVVKRVFNLPYIPTADQRLDELGADSINIISLAAELKSHLGWQVELELLTPDRTLRSISKLHFGDVNRARYITYNEQHKPTIFCFPPASGLGFCYKPLSQQLQNRSLVSFHFIESCSDIVGTYCDDISRLRQAEIHLIGFSGGGNLAMQVAQMLSERKIDVHSVTLIDAFIHTVPYKRLPEKVRAMRDKLTQQTLAELTHSGLPVNMIQNRIFAYYQHHWQSLLNDEKINCPILQVNAQDQALINEINSDPELGEVLHDNWSFWTEHPDSTKVYVDASHYEMMTRPYVECIAIHIKDFMASINTEQGHEY